MTVFQAFILGIVQGLTEFLPISSSGHLVLVPAFLDWPIPEEQAFVFDVLTQLGTLVAVLVYFWKDLVRIAAAMLEGARKGDNLSDPGARLGWLILLATLPAAVGGLLLKPQIESAFGSPRMTGYFLFVTAGLLVFAEWVGKRERRTAALNWRDALAIGTFQILAMFPGVSRSGATIAGGMSRHLDRQSATRFSFLMAIPVMPGAGLLSLIDLLSLPDLSGFLLPLAVGFITSSLTGYFAIRWLIAFLSRNSLLYFAVYVLILGITVLWIL